MLHFENREIKPHRKVVEQIEENTTLLLMMQHFNVDFRFDEKSIKQISQEIDVSEELLVAVANLYCGYKPKESPIKSKKDVKDIIQFLKNSHKFYREEKYPEIITLIRELQKKHHLKELEFLESFFNEYFEEVKEHLDYEDNIAFPYFIRMVEQLETNKIDYSSKEYQEHHTDIEIKLKDFKNLLLKHIRIKGDYGIRRKLLNAIFELEYDLYIHSLIEDTILIPTGKMIEKNNHGIIS